MSKPLRVKCPTCGTEIEWITSNTNRPFCSERCKNKDFIAWANEEQVMGGSAEYDDVLSEDLQKH
jgi:hypothetical protein